MYYLNGLMLQNFYCRICGQNKFTLEGTYFYVQYIKMVNLYKIEHIEGKNLGCVSLENIKVGTLILQETPQCVVLNLVPQFLGENDVSSILNSFKSMSDTNQKEYLKLHNRFAIFNDLNQEDKKKVNHKKQLLEDMKTDPEDMGKSENILGKYKYRLINMRQLHILFN